MVLLLLIYIINHLVISIVPILSVKVVEFLHAELILISIVRLICFTRLLNCVTDLLDQKLSIFALDIVLVHEQAARPHE